MGLLRSLAFTSFYKIAGYRTFWVLSIGVSLLLFSVAHLIFNLEVFPVAQWLDEAKLWSTMAWLVKGSGYVFSLLMIFLVCNDFTYQTNKQFVINGWSRHHLILSYVFMALVFCFVQVVFCACLVHLTASRHSLSVNYDANAMVTLASLITCALTQLLFAMTCSIFLKKSMPSVMTYGFCLLFLEPVGAWYFKLRFNLVSLDYLPFQNLEKLIASPFQLVVDPMITTASESVWFIAVAYIGFFYTLSYLRLHYTDL